MYFKCSQRYPHILKGPEEEDEDFCYACPAVAVQKTSVSGWNASIRFMLLLYASLCQYSALLCFDSFTII